MSHIIPSITCVIGQVEELFRNEWPSSAEVFLPAPEPGTLFRSPGIAATYRRIVDEVGGVRTFCVYGAPDPETVRSHGERLGQHTIDDLWEIAGDVTPADFPSVS